MHYIYSLFLNRCSQRCRRRSCRQSSRKRTSAISTTMGWIRRRTFRRTSRRPTKRSIGTPSSEERTTQGRALNICYRSELIIGREASAATRQEIKLRNNSRNKNAGNMSSQPFFPHSSHCFSLSSHPLFGCWVFSCVVIVVHSVALFLVF